MSIEKAVIIAQDKSLHPEIPEVQTPAAADRPTKTLEEMERLFVQ